MDVAQDVLSSGIPKLRLSEGNYEADFVCNIEYLLIDEAIHIIY